MTSPSPLQGLKAPVTTTPEPATEDKIYCIGVRFRDRGVDSKIYTYKSPTPYCKGDIVLVPTGDFYSVAIAVGCKHPYTFDPARRYSEVICKLDVSFKYEGR